jgi:hypothetical protein
MGYFAHAAYGVVLDEDDRNQLSSLLGDLETEDPGPLIDGNDPDEKLDVLLERHPDLLSTLQKKYGAPESAALISTGHEHLDDSSGTISAGDWILGYGVLRFPFGIPRDLSPSDFKQQGGWHLWVAG